MTHGISVVIPTYRRNQLLLRCLQALKEQTFPARRTEVIVCDDDADRTTQRLVECFAQSAPFKLQYVAVTNTQGPAAARNRGWRKATHDVIAFTDDDTIPDPEWLQEGFSAISGALAVSGRVVVPLTARPTDYERNESGLERAEFVTANCFVRKAILENLGGFDERFTAAWREDSDLHFQILSSRQSPGLERVRVAPSAKVVHPVRPASWGISIRQQKKSVFNALLFAKHPVLYRRKIESGPPVPYYINCVAACVAAWGIYAGIETVAGGFAAIWGTTTTRFCLRRLKGTSLSPSHIAEMVVTSAAIPWIAIYWRLVGACKFRVAFL
jgi:glycosyltransferase involved in cell wall biosynthesis